MRAKTQTGDSTIDLLEANWVPIRDECLAVGNYVRWPESIYNGNWDVYGIYDLQGYLIEENATRCPKTTEVLKRIPNLRTAGFSKLGAGAHIKPHKGYTDAVLRCHLGLVVPEGDCALKVEETVYRWQEGKAFIFNDRLLHEAWNYTDSDRYVLLLDLYK
jgi:ornithine lipid ester-linked acyl 2-hydroxylase